MSFLRFLMKKYNGTRKLHKKAKDNNKKMVIKIVNKQCLAIAEIY